MEFLRQFTWIDGVVIAVIAASTLLSIARGLVKEIASLAIWVLALVGASRLAHYVAEALPQWLSAPIQQTLGFLIVLVVILLLGKLVTAALKEIMTAAGMGTMDRVLGMFFGLARGGIIAIVLGVLVAMTSLTAQDSWQQARMRPFLEFGIRTVTPWLPAEIENRLRFIKPVGKTSRLQFNHSGALACVA